MDHVIRSINLAGRLLMKLKYLAMTFYTILLILGWDMMLVMIYSIASRGIIPVK